MANWWVGDKTGRDPGAELNSLRRAIAELIGTDQDTWPTHGNAPLAIASAFALRVARIDELEAALNQHGHIAEFREDGYSLEHPVECRKIGMIDCLVNVACAAEQTMPVLEPGRYFVDVDSNGDLVVLESEPRDD